MKKKHMVREKPAGYENGAIVLFQTPDGSMSIDVRLEKETLWMDAHQMARLFGRDRSVIVRHIRNIYETNEMDPTSTCAKKAQVAADIGMPVLPQPPNHPACGFSSGGVIDKDNFLLHKSATSTKIQDFKA